MLVQVSFDNIEYQLSVSKIKLVCLLGIEFELLEGISWYDMVILVLVVFFGLDKNLMMLNLQFKVWVVEYEVESIKLLVLLQVNWVIFKSIVKDSNGNEVGWYMGLNVEWEVFSGGFQCVVEMLVWVKVNMVQQ